MATYFQDFCSNKAIIPSPSATQPNPARKPAVAPQAVLVLGSARNAARFAAISTENKNEKPKVFGRLPVRIWSSDKPTSFCQARPNRIGEYHSPPRTNVETAAT